MTALADAVNARRDEISLSVNQLALRSGLSWPTVRNICAGRTASPHPDTLARVEQALGWPEGRGAVLAPAIRQPGARPGNRFPHLGETTHKARPVLVATGAPVVDYAPSDVLRLDVPAVYRGPERTALTLPDPSLRWRSPRNLAGRVEQVERWTYALAVARIIVEQAEGAA